MLRRHRLLAFCAVTFGISWGGILLLIGPGSVALDAEHLAVLLGLGYVAMLAAPTTAAMVLTAILDGRAGLRRLRAEATRGRVGGRWWLVAVLIAPASIAAVLLGLSLASPDFLPRLLVDEDAAGLVQYVAVTAALTGVLEELGWTGFVTPMLLPRQGVLRTGLIVGLIVAAWNFLIVLVRELAVPTPGDLPLVVLLLVGLFTWQVAYRVLIVWTYDRSRSLLLAMVMETTLVAAWTALTPVSLTQPTLILFYLALTLIWSLMGWVALRDRGQQAQAMPAVG